LPLLLCPSCFFACSSFLLYQVKLHRRPLFCSFLREAPYDDVLHEACPEYETEEIRKKREHEEAMRVRHLLDNTSN
jgi:hypothetical protein